jgi:formylglycine-generating enzyme required for sulfatase activity
MQRVPDNLFEYDVFICHSSKDKPIIKTLIEDFKKENITYWVDAEHINYGDQITRKIEDGLNKSKYVIPCLSKDLNTSGWTRAEYGAILNAEFSGNSERIVIPLMLDNCDVNDIPALLRDKRRVIYLDKTDFDGFINFLKKNQNDQKQAVEPLKKETENLERETDDNTLVPATSKHIPKPFTSCSTSMEFVLIPAGNFMMGSPDYEQHWNSSERPEHKVIIKDAFYMGKYPVTQKQWKKIMGYNPSKFRGEDQPVESVSWRDAQEFLRRLNEIESTNKYRLPTEAEWEYACRAGTLTKFYFGDNESRIGDYAWLNKNSSDSTHPVGEKEPNSWNLFDMYGNIKEWCQDKYHDNYNGAPSDGSVWESGNSPFRVVRGGGFNDHPLNCRSVSRSISTPDSYSIVIGFRLVREV